VKITIGNPELLVVAGQDPQTEAELRAVVEALDYWELVGAFRVAAPRPAIDLASDACYSPSSPRQCIPIATAFEQIVRSAKSFLIGLGLLKRGISVEHAAEGTPSVHQ